jgi:hypothetical protein
VLSGSHDKSCRFAKEALVVPEAIQQLGAGPRRELGRLVLCELPRFLFASQKYQRISFPEG